MEKGCYGACAYRENGESIRVSSVMLVLVKSTQ